MSSITLKQYKKKENRLSSKPYTFVDLKLDLEPKKINFELTETSTVHRDIVVSYDEFAIKNSLINIFNTIPGQRFLIPLFGCNLYAYLFQPVTEAIANAIGNEILRAIELWEPRVVVDKVNVVGRPDDHEYLVTIMLTIPKLKIRTNLTGVISREGFKESQI